jgi:hypothetical protein
MEFINKNLHLTVSRADACADPSGFEARIVKTALSSMNVLKMEAYYFRMLLKKLTLQWLMLQGRSKTTIDSLLQSHVHLLPIQFAVLESHQSKNMSIKSAPFCTSTYLNFEFKPLSLVYLSIGKWRN